MAAGGEGGVFEREIFGLGYCEEFVAAVFFGDCRTLRRRRRGCRLHDGEVFEMFAPEDGIVEMGVADVLEFFELVGFGGFVAGGEAFDGGVVVEEEAEIGGEVDGGGHVFAVGEVEGAAALGGEGFDGFVDGGCVVGFAVAGGAELFDVEGGGGDGGLGDGGRGEVFVLEVGGAGGEGGGGE